MDNPNLGKVVQFTNITDKDFQHAYGGQPFFVKAHETVVFPWDLADHLATHLARRIFVDGDSSLSAYDPQDKTGGQGKPLYSPEDEILMKAKILGQTFNEEVMAPKSEMELLKEKVAELQEKFGGSSVPQASAVAAVTTAPAPVEQIANVPSGSTADLGYQSKPDVMAELAKRGIAFDARQSKAKLEALLNQPQ